MNQKALVLALSALTAIGLGFARQTKADDQVEKTALEGKSAEVVAVNAEAKSITVRKATTEGSGIDSETLTVEGKALASLKDFKVGDKVVLTCKAASGDAAATGTDVPKPEAGSGAPTSSAKPCVVTDIAKAPEK